MWVHHIYCARPSSFLFEGDCQWTGTCFHFNDCGDDGLISRDDVWSIQVTETSYPSSNIQFLPELRHSSLCSAYLCLCQQMKVMLLPPFMLTGAVRTTSNLKDGYELRGCTSGKSL